MITFRQALAGLLAATLANLSIAQTADDATLRQEFADLRARLDALEQRLEQQQPSYSSPAPTSASADASNAYNPAMGIIFMGQAWDYQGDGAERTVPGFPYGGEAGPFPSGLALGETELDFSASVDDKFTAWLTLPVAIEDGEAVVEIEEAWIETTALPAGLSARVGRFYSGVGYLNGKHAHAWDFADQPLVYQTLMGGQYGDTGVQMRWLAPTLTYLEFGTELLRGDNHPAGGAAHSGLGAWSAFANIGGDIGFDASWLAGVSLLKSDSAERASGDEDAPLLFSGATDTLIVHGVWKWAPNGNWKQRNAVIQGEYIQQRNDGVYTLENSTASDYAADQSGWYLQGVYQPFPRWRFGARYDRLSTDNPGLAFVGSALEPDGDPSRTSLMVDWSNSEFSRLRLQYTRDMTSPESENQWGLQYIFSIGAHGAHSF